MGGEPRVQVVGSFETIDEVSSRPDHLRLRAVG